jgi:hypothetical protein
MKRTTIIQALSFKTGGDLVLINIFSSLLILVIFLFPNSPVRILLGLPFVLFFTGYVSISALFPKKEELDIIERLAFSTGLSIAITSLIGLILNYSPLGIRVYSVVFSLFSFIFLVSIVALYRRKIASPGDVLTPSAADGDKGKIDSVENSNIVKSETGFTSFFQKIKLEYIALPIFVATSLLFYHQRYFSYIFLVISAVIGVLFFIVFDRYFTKEEMDASFELPDDKSHTLRLVMTILFFVFYGLSFLTLLHGFYTKTIWYYVFISLCVGVIAAEILFVKTRTQGTINLIKSFLLVLNITLSNQILFPYGIGEPDSGYQIYSLVVPIINHGTVSAGSGSYVNFPGHHIFIAMNSLVMGTDPRMTYFCIGSLVMSVVGFLFVFLIGRKFINLKFGLFAALLYACADYLIFWASHPCQMTFTYPLALMIFAVVLYIYKERDWKFVAFFPILVTTMVFTHHFSTMVVFIILLSVALVEIFQYVKIPDYKFIFPRLAQLYVVILFTQWIYHSNMMGRFSGIIDAYKDAFTEEVATSIMTETYYDTLPIKTLLLNEIGSSILILLAVVGFLYFFKHRSFFTNVVMASAITFIILIGIGIIFKEPYLLPHRMYAFLQEFALVFLVSAAIIWILSNAKNIKSVKPVLVIGVIMCLSFFSLSSTIAGFETSPLAGDQAYWKIYDTPYDRYSREWIQAYTPTGSNITSRPPIKAGYKPNAYIIDAANITDDYFIRFSKFDITIGFKYGHVVAGTSHIGRSNWIKLDKNAGYLLDEYDRYYSNGMVDLYYKS